MTYLCWLLMWLEALSRLKINLEKSELFPVGRVTNAQLLADELGYKVGIFRLPTLGAHFNSEVVWDRVEEHFRMRPLDRRLFGTETTFS